MAKLSYSEIKTKKYIVFDGEPYEVLSHHVFRKQQRKPVNQTKLRHLASGRVVEHTFHQSDTAEEADIETRQIKFIYAHRGKFIFALPENQRERFEIAETIIGERKKYLKESMAIDALYFNDNLIDIKLPITLDLAVTEAPPAVKGDTAQGGTKPVTLETGATVNAPLFIQEGDIIRVNTDTNSYTSRIEKK